jgi:hypothetical protein
MLWNRFSHQPDVKLSSRHRQTTKNALVALSASIRKEFVPAALTFSGNLLRANPRSSPKLKGDEAPRYSNQPRGGWAYSKF